MNESFVFHTVSMDVGDLLEIKLAKPYRVSTPVQVAALNFDPKKNTLTVLVPYFLIRFAIERQLRLSEQDVKTVRVVMPAVEAVPCCSSTTAPFQHHDQVSFLAGGKPSTGQVIAAIEGIIAVRLPNGIILNGGATYFTYIKTSQATV